MRIAIVDDEERWRSEIGKHLADRGITEFDSYADGKALFVARKQYDILFMDIELEEENGFQVATRYRQVFPETLVIIVTTHLELSRQGYQINAFRYLDKYYLNEIDEALESAEKRIQDFKKMRVEVSGQGEIEVACRDIYYIEADHHKVRMCTVGGDYECREGISKITPRFLEEGFFLIHRAYLVNMRHIKEISPQGIVVENGDNLCISRRKYTEFRKEYIKWQLERSYG